MSSPKQIRASRPACLLLPLLLAGYAPLSCDCLVAPIPSSLSTNVGAPPRRQFYPLTYRRLDRPSSHAPTLSPPHPSALLSRSNGVHDGDDCTSTDNSKQGTGQKILSLAVPALAGLAIDPLMTLADTAFVGRYSTSAESLAGLGSAAALLTFAFYIFNFLCTATTPLVARQRASGDEAGASDVGGQALSLALVLGTILAAALIVGGHPLLSVMGTGSTGEVADAYASSFLWIRSLAAPAVFVSSAATGVLRGYFDTKSPVVILLSANAINLALDVVLIAGMGLGPTGAAIATTTAEWICAIGFLGILAGKLPSAEGELGSNQRRGDDVEAGTVRDINMRGAEEQKAELLTVVPSLSVPAWESIKPLVVASSSVFLRSVVLQIALSGAAAMAARSGGAGGGGSFGYETAAASVASHQIALQLWLLCSFVCDALAAASQALVADALGREDAKDARDVSNAVFAYGLGLGFALAAILQLGASTGFLVNFFTTDPATQTALSPLLTILVFAQPLNAFVFAADGVLQGASEFTYQAKSMALSVWVAVCSFIGLEYLGYGAEQGTETLVHIWYALIVLQLMRALTSLFKLVDNEGPIDLLGKQISA